MRLTLLMEAQFCFLLKDEGSFLKVAKDRLIHQEGNKYQEELSLCHTSRSPFHQQLDHRRRKQTLQNPVRVPLTETIFEADNRKSAAGATGSERVEPIVAE